MPTPWEQADDPARPASWATVIETDEEWDQLKALLEDAPWMSMNSLKRTQLSPTI